MCTRFRLTLSLLVIVAVAACDRSEPFNVRDNVKPRADVIDGENGGNPNFYWLPPTVTTRSARADGFSPDHHPVVEICEWVDECLLPLVAQFDSRTTPAVQLDPVGKSYVLQWDTTNYRLNPAATYRIRVLLEEDDIARGGKGVEIGAIDLYELARPTGRTLEIRFFIVQGPAYIMLSPASADVRIGRTIQLTRSALDVAGLPTPVGGTCAISNPGIATLAVAGATLQVTGVAAGTAVVTCSWQTGATGSATITVLGPPRKGVLALGVDHTCGIATNGRAYCWGSNQAGRLGDGSGMNSYVPVAVSGTRLYTYITAGFNHTCALDFAGAAYCWGSDSHGQLGNGTGWDQPTPGPVSGGLTFIAIGASGNSTCALRSNGTAYCWGDNMFGQLGDGFNNPRQTPQAVVMPAGVTFAALDVGTLAHSCGLTAGGAAYCWGLGAAGQLGNGNNGNSNVPAQVCPPNTAAPCTFATVLNLATIEAAWAHTCGVTTVGEAYCWGNDAFGALGTGAAVVTARSPARVSGTQVYAHVAGGENFACGLTTSDLVYCWGNNAFGQFGNALPASSFAPVAAAGGSPFARIVSGLRHVCGLTLQGEAFCWGNNGSGQVGDGFNAGPRTTPTAVLTNLRFR